MMNTWVVRLVGSVLALMVTLNVFATDLPKELTIVRPDGSWPPQEMVIDGELQGVHIDLVREAAKLLDISVSFESYPWRRAVQKFQQGEADAITYMGKTTEREAFGHFVDGNILSKASVGFFIQQANEGKFSFSGELESLKPYIIGTVKGFSYHEGFDTADFLQKGEWATKEEKLITMLMKGRVSIAIGHVNDIYYHAARLGVADEIMFLKPLLTEGRSHYIVFSKPRRHGELAKRFADAMNTLRANGTYQEIIDRYRSPE